MSAFETAIAEAETALARYEKAIARVERAGRRYNVLLARRTHETSGLDWNTLLPAVASCEPLAGRRTLLLCDEIQALDLTTRQYDATVREARARGLEIECDHSGIWLISPDA